MATLRPPLAHTGIKVRPAEPLLASSLIDSASLDAIFENLSTFNTIETSLQNPDVLQTGVRSIDDALGPTLQSGKVVAFGSETSNQRDDLAKTLLVDCLTRHTEDLVAVIDTTGNFDVVGLYRRILHRLKKEDEKVVEEGGRMCESVKHEREDTAAKVLDRVKIMRVFDFVGVKEAVGELRDGLERRASRTGLRQSKHIEEKVTARENMEADTNPAPLQKRIEVADSEDEDEEMLFDTEATTTTDPASLLESTFKPPLTAPSEQQEMKEEQSQPRVKLILIDNLAHVLTPLLKKDSVSANMLSAIFLTTLKNLTRTHHLHTILLNPCTTPRAPSPTRQSPSHSNALPQTNAPAPQQSYIPQPPPPPSIFTSQPAVPALLGLMSRYADTHVLLSLMPRRKMDARVYYADSGGRERGKRRGVEMVGVCEVIGDRWDGRLGTWGTFKEGSDGKGIESV